MVSKPVGMASDRAACPVSVPNLSLNPIASGSPFTHLQFHIAAPGPACAGSLMKQPPLPRPTVAAAFPPQGGPRVRPAFPSTAVVSGGRSYNLSGAGPSSVTVEMGTGGRPAVPLPNQTVILTQAPLIWNVPPGTFSPAGRAPFLLPGPDTHAPVTVPTNGQRQAAQDSLFMGLGPVATLPESKQAPIMPSVRHLGPWSQRPCAEGSVHTCQAKPSPPSVYQNFRRWQQFKTLVRKRLPQTPDMEALACFFIPVLRSLARLKPTMSLDEGLWRGLQEWECLSNYDRMSYHEMAAKFMEFEATEEMDNSKMTGITHFQGQPPAIPLNQDSPRPSPLDILQQPEGNSTKNGLKGQSTKPPASTGQKPPETKAPEEIPSEAMEEYMAIMDWLEGLPEMSTLKSEGTAKEEEMKQQDVDDMCSDPELLSLIDQLCSREDFMANVEAIIHPTFLEGVLSSKPELDLVALIEELEQEEGLTPDQIVQKRLGAPEGALGVCELATCQGAARNDQSLQQAVSADNSKVQIVSSDDQSYGGTAEEQLMPDTGVFQGGQGCPSPGATLSTASPHGYGSQPQHLGSGDAVNCTEESPGTPCKLVGDKMVDKESVSSLASLLGSEYHLLPWGISQSPKSSTILLCSGHQAPRPSLSKRRGGSLDPSPPAKFKERACLEVSCVLERNSHPGPCLEESAKQDLTLGLLQPSQPQKRKHEALDGQQKKRKKKKYRSQLGPE